VIQRSGAATEIAEGDDEGARRPDGPDGVVVVHRMTRACSRPSGRIADPSRRHQDPRPEAASVPRIAIACGGTAGHVFPALAVADAYRSLHPEVSLLFLGTGEGSESWLVPRRGHRFEALPAAPFFGVGTGRRLAVPLAAAVGAFRARRLLARERSQLLLGFGGFASAGPVLAAKSLGIPLVLFEANARAGLTHRLLGRFAERVLLGSEAAAPAFARSRIARVGVPVAPEVVQAGAERARLPRQPFRVLVCGGSLGSRFLDEHAPELLRRVTARGVSLQVRHQVGTGAPEDTRSAYARLGIEAEVTPFIEDMAGAYAWADFAVACGGAATLAELAAAALPSLLVPLSWAALDHQTANVRAVAEESGALWTREADWDPERHASDLARLATSPDAWWAAATAMRRTSRPDAAQAVVEACEAALREVGLCASPVETTVSADPAPPA
jgi:UDP-N-acetylglucosamine--N-acetylmuramyl-(pentapeptide) pyrophosphoryl-undecaprenol N-acetylglucosamine transferase